MLGIILHVLVEDILGKIVFKKDTGKFIASVVCFENVLEFDNWGFWNMLGKGNCIGGKCIRECLICLILLLGKYKWGLEDVNKYFLVLFENFDPT